MNDRHDPHGQIYGYDEYGRPLYHPGPEQAHPPPYQGYEGYGDPAAQQGGQGGPEGYGQYGNQQGYGGYDAYQQPYDYGSGAPAGYPRSTHDGHEGHGDHRNQGAYGGYETHQTYGAYGSYESHQGGERYEGYDAYGAYQGYGDGRGGYGSGTPHDANAATGGDTGPQPPVYGPDAAYPSAPSAAPGQAPGAPAPPAPPGEAAQPGVPRQRRRAEPAEPEAAPAAPAGSPPDAPAASGAPDDEADRGPGGAYDGDQFAFTEERNDESEDVIDWLKFTESRTERREEVKRRGRNRVRLLAAALVLAVLGTTGYLWANDRLPGIPGPGSESEAAPEAQVRDVFVVHLRETGDAEETSTALLVANETTGEGTTLLLPGELSVSVDDETAPLAQAAAHPNTSRVRDGLGGLLGADIKGTWRLDTPYLEVLVNAVGGITVDTDAEVPAEPSGGDGAAADGDGESDGAAGDGGAADGGEGSGSDAGPLVAQGEDVPLNGQAAIAYATHRAPDEAPDAQLERFGQVLEAVLERMPTGEETALQVVHGLGQIADPSLPEEELAVSLADRAALAQDGAYRTTLLPVEQDGSISAETADGLVSDVLGGAVSNPDPDGPARIGIQDASGADVAESARIDLVNGGFTVLDSRPAADTRPSSEVSYTDEAHRETAVEAARTLGLPEDAVRQGDGAGNADVTIVLGEDYAEE